MYLPPLRTIVLTQFFPLIIMKNKKRIRGIPGIIEENPTE